MSYFLPFYHHAVLTCDRSSTDPADARKAEKSKRDNPDTGQQHRSTSPSENHESSGSKAKNEKLDPQNATTHGLPPLLSPVHDPLGNPYGLPNILSPTLPSNIQAELDRLEVQRQRAASNASTSSSDRKSQTLAVPNASAQKPSGTPKSETRPRSVSATGDSPNIEAPSRTVEADPSLVVKLKFSKTKVPTVKQILRLPPKRPITEKKERPDKSKNPLADMAAKPVENVVIKKKKIPTVAARRHDASTPASSPAPTSTAPTSSTKPVVTVTKVPEKRPRTDDDVSSAAPAKRARAQSNLDRPVTPARQIISSPALSNKSSAQKGQPQYETPPKNSKSITMLRTNSTDGHDATPGRSGATPAGTKVDPKAGPTSAPLNSKKQAEISLLAQTSMKLNQTGRALKHEATRILTAPGNKITKQDEKRAAVTNLECILYEIHNPQ